MITILLCLLAVGQADVTIDTINAGLAPGLQKVGENKVVGARGIIKNPGKPWKVARIWTAGDLIKKFGEPTDRKSGDFAWIHDKTGKKMSYPAETWTWERDDGSVKAEFAMRGYGLSDGKPETLRLQIYKVKLNRK